MKTFKKRILSVLACVTVMLSMASTSFAASSDKVVRLAFTDAPTLNVGDMQIYHPSYAAMLAFKGSFEKSTGGEYTVELYPNGVLGDAASTMEQMLTGTLTGSTPADGALSAFAPDIQVFTIPYLFDTPTIAYDVLDGPFGQQLFDKIAKETGFRVIAAYDNGGYRNFTNSKREIRSAADMAGLNIRVMDSPVYLKMMEALGASATPVAFLELYSALQTGVVDGQENSAVTTLGASLDEVQPYCTLDGHLLGLAFLTISEDWYQSLDAETQAKVDAAGREATLASRGTCRYAEALAVSTLSEKGVQVYSPTAEELASFKVAQEPVIEYLRDNLSDPALVEQLFAAIETASSGASAQQPSGGNTDPAPAPSGSTPAPAPSGSAAPSNQPSDSGSSSGGINPVLIGGVVVVLLIVVFLVTRKKKD